MSYAYYQQFTDDEDLFHIYESNEDDTNFFCDEDDTELNQIDCIRCSDRGCNHCLGVEW